MDYEVMLDYHKSSHADVTLATYQVPMEEASRFGVVITDENGVISEFEEKPEHPRSNKASMGIYIFSWPVLRDALIEMKDVPSCDFGKHVIPRCHEQGKKIVAYDFKGYWKDVGTLGSYWEANMELVDIIPEFNLYEEFWRIYTKSDNLPPQYIADESTVQKSIVGEGTEIYGEVINSVIGSGVVIGKGTVVKDSIIMNNVTIGDNASIEKSILAEGVSIGDGTTL
jgi:glucose-1-phosphate adenylyltransferase